MKSGPTRARLAVPASTTRSSRSSTRESSSARADARARGRAAAGSSRSGTAASSLAASVRVRPAVARLSSVRSVRQGALAVVAEQVGADVDDPLLDPAGGGDEHDEQPLAADRHELDVAHRRAGQRRVLHDRDLPGQRGEQAHGAVDDVVEVDGALEELGDGALLGGAHRLHGREPVDEQAVAGIGGHPPGAGVRGGDQPLLLERGHVVAHGRGRHPEVVALEQRLGADRLGGLHVVLDDGAQHAQPAVLAHHAVTSGTSRRAASRGCWHSRARSANSTGWVPTRANAGDRPGRRVASPP